MLRLAAVCAAALTCAAPAGAHTDGGPGLALVWPANGTVTRGFGYDGAEWHSGIDIGSLVSLDVTAAAPGVVEAVAYAPGFEGYGNIVLVDLGGGMQALYAHLSEIAAHVGQPVDTGQLLGLAGCTGYCTGTHLHFELREDGTAIDPAPFLPATIP
ncbi:MAG TPA: M23 family metallopeptidase [Gaiellaceae bacterium]|jgi:murein DD-endopeptidase MepM/ murein hydrolase activator NlpD|nr:M23 family metallopeptidase [Gaiellaceae bacterium]